MGMERLILDLRNNSGGFLNQAIEVADKFIGGNQVLVYTKGRIDGSSQHYYSTDGATHERLPADRAGEPRLARRRPRSWPAPSRITTAVWWPA